MIEPCLDFGQTRIAPDYRLTALQRLLHAVEQQLLVVGLLDEIHRAGLERAHDDGHVGVTADEDDRQVDTPCAHLLLHIEPAHARHTHIEQHAGIGQRIAGLEKGATACERHAL
ncbi:hypothetical protein N619_03435 [Ectopseudomonas oleovorans]|nr:hypothetical protein N619_03435 [Pseudomonas oleovorans]